MELNKKINAYLSIFLSIICILFQTHTVQSKEIEMPQGQFMSGNLQISFKTEVLASNLNYPWSLAFLPDNRILVTEKTGHIKIVSEGQETTQVTGVPEVFFKSQGGLFDLVLDPEFVKNQKIYFSYAHGNMQANATYVASAKFSDTSLRELKTIFKVTPNKDTPVHYGGKLLFLPDNSLLLTTGDGFDYRESAQDPQSLLGKIVRFNRDGSIPSNNPFVGSKKFHPAIYSLGHRNPQGIAYDRATQQIVMHEHGPAGGDEINIIKAGKNYGWPIATHGKDYSGAIISPFESYPGTEQPLLHWTPSIAPSGLVIYSGEEFPELVGNYLVGALAARELRLVVMKNGEVVEQQSLLKELNRRFRDIREGPDGAIYLLTDGEQGQLIRISRL